MQPIIMGKLARTPLEYNLDEYGSHFAVIEAALSGEIKGYDMDTVIRSHANAMRIEIEELQAQLTKRSLSCA